MREVYKAAQMQALDAYTIEQMGLDGLVLMERAALAVADRAGALFACKSETEQSYSKILVLCGMGNNGGDGIAAARILYERGRQVEIVLVGDYGKASPSMKKQLAIVKNMDIPILQAQKCDVNQILFHEYNGIIDALFGIGLSRDVQGVYKDMIEAVNGAGKPVLAVDMPSGIHTDTGRICGVAVEADETVTFGYLKPGLLLYPGRGAAGNVTVADIGFARKPFGDGYITYDKQDLSGMPYRPACSHKGTYGKVLVIAGSKGMAGAALLSAKAAYRIGAGLVKVLTDEENRQVIQTALPEAIVSTYKDEIEDNLLQDACAWADAVVLGPGIGREKSGRKLVRQVLKWKEEEEIRCKKQAADTKEEVCPAAPDKREKTLVMDADALTILSEMPQYFEKKSQFGDKEGEENTAVTGCRSLHLPVHCILTPHLRELSRLLQVDVPALAENLPYYARKALGEEKEIVMVAKDSATVVADEQYLYINQSGCEAMATGGSGDVLSGVIGGLLAQGMQTAQAARLGVYIHGLAGEKAAERRASYSVMAGDILDALGDVGVKRRTR